MRAADAWRFVQDGMELLMSTMNPSVSSQVFDPPNPPGELADAILTSLERPGWGYWRRPWGPLMTLVLAAVSFGVLPLLVWPHRFRRLMRVEQQQLWHLAEWLRLRTGSPRATELRDNSLKAMPAFNPGVIPLILVVTVFIGNFHFWWDYFYYYHDWAPLWTSAYGLGDNSHLRLWLHYWPMWTVALSIGYFDHWHQIGRHANAVAQYAKTFKEIIADEKLLPVEIPGVGTWLHPIWGVVAIIGIGFHAYWAVPMALAGAVHVRYVRVTSRQLRSDLAQRVRWMLQKNRPAVSLRGPNEPRPCTNEKCRAIVPAGALFCPRCGARTT